MLFRVDWEKEAEKAKELVAKADLADALQVAALEDPEEDSFDPTEVAGKPPPSLPEFWMCVLPGESRNNRPIPSASDDGLDCWHILSTYLSGAEWRIPE